MTHRGAEVIDFLSEEGAFLIERVNREVYTDGFEPVVHIRNRTELGGLHGLFYIFPGVADQVVDHIAFRGGDLKIVFGNQVGGHLYFIEAFPERILILVIGTDQEAVAECQQGIAHGFHVLYEFLVCLRDTSHSSTLPFFNTAKITTHVQNGKTNLQKTYSFSSNMLNFSYAE